MGNEELEVKPLSDPQSIPNIPEHSKAAESLFIDPHVSNGLAPPGQRAGSTCELMAFGSSLVIIPAALD